MGVKTHQFSTGKFDIHIEDIDGLCCDSDNPPKEKEKSIKQSIADLAGKMESSSASLTSKLPETYHFKECRKVLSLPTVASNKDALATQFSIGRDYWSQAH